MKPDLAYGLVLIHCLCIESGLSIEQVALLFASLADDVVIEFVPHDDSKVRKMIQAGHQVPGGYTLENCIAAFRKYYKSIPLSAFQNLTDV